MKRTFFKGCNTVSVILKIIKKLSFVNTLFKLLVEDSVVTFLYRYEEISEISLRNKKYKVFNCVY